MVIIVSVCSFVCPIFFYSFLCNYYSQSHLIFWQELYIGIPYYGNWFQTGYFMSIDISFNGFYWQLVNIFLIKKVINFIPKCDYVTMWLSGSNFLWGSHQNEVAEIFNQTFTKSTCNCLFGNVSKTSTCINHIFKNVPRVVLRKKSCFFSKSNQAMLALIYQPEDTQPQSRWTPGAT